MGFLLIVMCFFRVVLYNFADKELHQNPPIPLRKKTPFWLNPCGSTGVEEYLLCSFCLFLIGTVIAIAAMALFILDGFHMCEEGCETIYFYSDNWFLYLIFPAVGLLIFTTFSITLQRLRGQGRSLWLAVPMSVPYFGAFWAIPWLIKRGEREAD